MKIGFLIKFSSELNPKNIMTMKAIYKILILLIFTAPSILSAQDDKEDSGSTSIGLSKEVISPSTLMWQLQLEEKIVTKYEGVDGIGQKFRVRMIIPIEKTEKFKYSQLIRFIAFYNSLPDQGSGLGDMTFNQFFILQEKDWGDWGIGYNVQIPTAKNPLFGSPQVSVGPAFTITLKDLGSWEMYYIIQNFIPVSKTDEFGRHITMVFQPNIFYTWPNGIYTGIEPLWQYDFKAKGLDFPLNLRLGYIFQSGKYKYNTYVEPEWKTYRSEVLESIYRENFAVKLGFRIFFPE